MNHELEEHLKQDARAIQAQAVARLEHKDFSQNFEAMLVNKSSMQSSRSKRPWLVAVAAAVCLTVLTWMTWQNSELTVVETPVKLVVLDTMELNLNQYPQSIEHKLNQPLVKEQQAIIDDLKALREQLLSI